MNEDYSKINDPFKAYEGDGKYIFISYKHDDRNLVYPVIKKFHDAGFNIWYDNGLRYGEDYDDLITEKIEESSLFVVCITERVMKNADKKDEYMKKELDVALDDVPIFPIFLEDVKLRRKYKMHLKGKHSIFRHEHSNEESFINACVDAFINDFRLEPTKSDKTVTPIMENKPNFKCLENLIRDSEDNSIILENNFFLSEDELDFEDGIKLNSDNLIIDGQNHSIDAKNRVRIFDVFGGNVVLKNIKFRNAYINDDGGAIIVRRNTSLTVDSCEFENSHSGHDGGAILNLGKLRIVNSRFVENNSKSCGGAIRNDDHGVLEISHSRFSKNDALDGGSIVNYNLLKIFESDFDGNHAIDSAGALLNYGRCKIGTSVFSQNSSNHAQSSNIEGGGAVHNYTGEMTIFSSKFEDNFSKLRGGAIFNMNGSLIIHYCGFKNNKAEIEGDSLKNGGYGAVKIADSKFDKSQDKEISFENEKNITCENSIFG